MPGKSERDSVKELLWKSNPIPQAAFNKYVICDPKTSIPVVLTILEDIKNSSADNEANVNIINEAIEFFKMLDADQKIPLLKVKEKMAIPGRYQLILLDKINKLLNNFDQLKIDHKIIYHLSELETWLYGLFFHTFNLYKKAYKSMDIQETYFSCLTEEIDMEQLIVAKHCELYKLKLVDNADKIVFDTIDFEDSILYANSGKTLTKMGVCMAYWRAAQKLTRKRKEFENKNKAEKSTPILVQSPKLQEKIEQLNENKMDMKQEENVIPLQLNQIKDENINIKNENIEVSTAKQEINEQVSKIKKVEEIKSKKPIPEVLEQEFFIQSEMHSHLKALQNVKTGTVTVIKTETFQFNSLDEARSHFDKIEQEEREKKRQSDFAYIEEKLIKAGEYTYPENIYALSNLLIRDKYNLFEEQAERIADIGMQAISVLGSYQRHAKYKIGNFIPQVVKEVICPNSHHVYVENIKIEISKALLYDQKKPNTFVDSVNIILKILLKARNYLVGETSTTCLSSLDVYLTDIINLLSRNNKKIVIYNQNDIFYPPANYYSKNSFLSSKPTSKRENLAHKSPRPGQ